MPVTTYTVIGGVIVHEDRDGVQRNYRPDTNGNTAALTDATTATDTWEYWPYGEVRTRTGTTATPFQFGGVLGYYRDSSTRTYVRARHYRQGIGRWQTVDPLWPVEPPYAYCAGWPHECADPTGLAAVLACGKKPCEELQGVWGGCIAFLCSLNSAKEVYEFLKKFLTGKTWRDLFKRLKDLLQGPIGSPDECCREAGRFVGGIGDVGDVFDLIGLACSFFKGNNPAGRCAAITATESECLACCAVMRGYGAKWRPKCEEYCLTKIDP